MAGLSFHFYNSLESRHADLKAQTRQVTSVRNFGKISTIISLAFSGQLGQFGQFGQIGQFGQFGPFWPVQT